MEENKAMETNVFDTELDEVTNEKSGNGFFAKFLVTAAAIGVGTFIALKATKEKREKKKDENAIKRLRKKGYIVRETVEVCDAEVTEVETTEED